MITIRPVQRALVPVDSAAAERISGSNYDEFQSDEEIWEILQQKPDSILRVTMPHCDVPQPTDIKTEGTPAVLERAVTNLRQMVEGGLTQVVENVLWVYEIESPSRPGVRQIGLGGMASTAQIRTPNTPQGTIIRNEGIRQAKVRGRAQLIEKTRAYIGTVNNAIGDPHGVIAAALEHYADARPCHFTATDQLGNRHRIWLVREANVIDRFIKLFESEPHAYVADGNHRSAAAAMLGYGSFLAVFFPAARMGLAPYNRLVKRATQPVANLEAQLRESFTVEVLGDLPAYRPEHIHRIGLYAAHTWYQLTPKPSAFDPQNAVQSIDADIVQRQIFSKIFGITDERDEALTFVGGNKDSAYLKHKVDAGEFDYAISLAPVTMEQFIAVCEQNQFMPPKSTWFMPKIRSGLVMALLE